MKLEKENRMTKSDLELFERISKVVEEMQNDGIDKELIKKYLQILQGEKK